MARISKSRRPLGWSPDVLGDTSDAKRTTSGGPSRLSRVLLGYTVCTWLVSRSRLTHRVQTAYPNKTRLSRLGPLLVVLLASLVSPRKSGNHSRRQKHPDCGSRARGTGAGPAAALSAGGKRPRLWLRSVQGATRRPRPRLRLWLRRHYDGLLSEVQREVLGPLGSCRCLCRVLPSMGGAAAEL